MRKCAARMRPFTATPQTERAKAVEQQMRCSAAGGASARFGAAVAPRAARSAGAPPTSEQTSTGKREDGQRRRFGDDGGDCGVTGVGAEDVERRRLGRGDRVVV